MTQDNIQKLVCQAHKILNQTSIFEVIDMDREEAIFTLRECYDNVADHDFERYMAVLERLREEIDQES